MFDKKKAQKSSEPEMESQAVDDFQKPPIASVSTVSTVSTVSASSRKGGMIGATITIKGDITGDENLLIEGKVEGTVDLNSNDLTIGQSGRVSANVMAKEIKIEGEVKGDISGNEKVVISKTGKVHGNIIAPRVTLEDGANFKGSIDMDPTVQASAVPPLKTFKAPDKVQKVATDQEKSQPTAAVKIR